MSRREIRAALTTICLELDCCDGLLATDDPEAREQADYSWRIDTSKAQEDANRLWEHLLGAKRTRFAKRHDKSTTVTIL